MENLAYEEEYEDEKVEIIDGVEYAMAPPRLSHKIVTGNIYGIIRDFLRKKRCKVFMEAGLVLGDDELIPDLMVVCDPSKIKEMYIEGAPDFVAEVLSRSTEMRDRVDKFKIYEKAGVKEYWIVDIWGRSVDVYKLQDGKFILTKVHRQRTEKELSKEDQNALNLTLKLSLYDDLEFDISEVFEDI